MSRSAPRFTHVTAGGEIVERLAVYIPQDLKADMARLAKSRGQSVTYAVIAAIRGAVDSADAEGAQ